MNKVLRKTTHPECHTITKNTEPFDLYMQQNGIEQIRLHIGTVVRMGYRTGPGIVQELFLRMVLTVNCVFAMYRLSSGGQIYHQTITYGVCVECKVVYVLLLIRTV